MISAKKGGRIVKGKKTAVRTGAAKRGFGRAIKKEKIMPGTMMMKRPMMKKAVKL